MAKKTAKKKTVKKAAKKKSTKKAVGKSMPWETLNGIAICIDEEWLRNLYAMAFRAVGARVVSKVSEKIDYLVVWHKRGKASPAVEQARALNANEGTNIKVLALQECWDVIAPTREGATALFHAGKKGAQIWELISRMVSEKTEPLDLTGLKMPKAELKTLRLEKVILDQADFSGAQLESCQLVGGTGLRLDGAQLKCCVIKNLTKSSAKNLQYMGEHLAIEYAEESVFDGAVLNADRQRSHYTDLRKFHKSSFRKIQGHGIELARFSRGTESDFTDADLTEADALEAELSGCVFRRAKLVRANLLKCKLRNADLRDADFRGAILSEADLTGAKVDGANFEGDCLLGAKLTRVAHTKAQGLSPEKTKMGPALSQLNTIAKKAESMTIRAEVALDDGFVQLSLKSDARHLVYSWEAPKNSGYHHWHHRTFGQAFSELAHLWHHGELRFDAIKVSGKKSPVKGKQLKDLVLAACCEAFETTMPVVQRPKGSSKEARAAANKARDQLVKELLGKDGVKNFNARSRAKLVKAGSFHNTDLAGTKLNGVKFPKLDLQSSNFEGATLSRSVFDECKCGRANFKNANLRDANLSHSGLNAADFTGANLCKARLIGCSLRKALFTGAQLAGASLARADLIGADFSSADLACVNFAKTCFDETTKFPTGYKLPTGMDWRGKGANPTLLVRKKKVGSLSIEKFMERLGESVDAQRLKKAVKMLKADRFQLFVQISDDSLVGVVKSQRDKDLVYSCQLKRDGAFACCTQNLNACGGLRGALCKHLLVLIVGLTKAGDIDAAEIDNWIAASKAHKPALDKDVMSETLLRYKGAEAGEIDWRPTETVPEDYYAF